jgi:hypothetical protein
MVEYFPNHFGGLCKEMKVNFYYILRMSSISLPSHSFYIWIIEFYFDFLGNCVFWVSEGLKLLITIRNGFLQNHLSLIIDSISKCNTSLKYFVPSHRYSKYFSAYLCNPTNNLRYKIR